MKDFDRAIQVLWNTIKDLQKENEKLKEDIKKLEDGLFKCNELKNNYKVCNENAITYIKSNFGYLPNITQLIKKLNNEKEK